MNSNTLLYIVLILVAAYALYSFYFDCSAYEDFDNNSSVRSDPAGDKSWNSLPTKDKIRYL